MDQNIRELYAYSKNNAVFVGNRIRVRGKSNMTLLPDFFLVEVYNPSPKDMATIINNGELNIRTKNNASMVLGEIEDVYSYRSGGNEVYSISVSDGQTFWESKARSSVGPGATFSATIRHILRGAKMGSYLAKDGRFVRPQTFSGRVADIVSGIAKGVHARAFISKNVLHVVEKGRSEVIITIEEDEVIAKPNAATGVIILRTDVKGWPVGMIVQYSNKNYRLASQEVNADNFEGTWQTELTLVDESYLDSDGMDGG